jgi:hypothetical protein
MSPLASAAVAHARRGWRVFPLMPREKKPYANTSGLTNASADDDQVADWWAGKLALPKADPDRPASWATAWANIGVATGAGSGFWVLDIDGEAAFAALGALEQVHGPLPPTVQQTTGKGAHFLFRWPDGVEIRNSASRIGQGIDVRGEGGYIVVAPSVHPSGRAYGWAPGCAPSELAIADAPDWLLKLAAPPEVASAPAAVSRRRVDRGRASPYGETALGNACRDIERAPAGRQNSTLWARSCAIGCLVAGEELERSYAEREMIAAGLRMPAHGKPWTLKVVESAVTRAFEWAENHPRRAPERRGPQAAALRPTTGQVPESEPETPADAASAVLDAAALWASAEAATNPAAWIHIRRWFSGFGLDVDAVPGALQRFRAHGNAPWNFEGESGPAMIFPLVVAPGAPVDAVAVLPLHPLCTRIALIIGDAGGKAIVLSDLAARDPSSPLIVALDVQDGWALCADAAESGFEPRLVICPTVRSFAGAAMGDRFGRLDPEQPQSDPAQAPWTWPDAGSVLLAVRRDLRPVEVRSRKFAGGTARQNLSGEAAARFWGGLADQAWRRVGANPVRILQPSRGCGFNSAGEA